MDFVQAPDTTEGRQYINEMTKRQVMLNKGKRLPVIPRTVLRASDDTKVFIFNVGPKRQVLECASYGTKILLGCPVGRDYSDPVEIPGIPWEPYNVEGNKLEAQFHGEDGQEDTGWDFAGQVIGVGKYLNPKQSMERFGVFRSRNNPPLPEEVERAKKRLFENYALEVAEANEAYAVGRFNAIRQDYHYEAARALGKSAAECKWLMDTTENANTEICQFCGVGIKATVARCPNCKEIVNQAAYEEAKRKASSKKAS
jgi:hypothetical protein